MNRHMRTGPMAAGFIACVLVSCLAAGTALSQNGAGTNSAGPATNDSVQALSVQSLSAQLNLLEQAQTRQEAMLTALELTRREIEFSLAQNVSNSIAHLNAMTELLANQRAQDLKIIHDSNRFILAVVIGLSGLLLLCILFLTVTSIRAIHRLSSVFSTMICLPPSAVAPPLVSCGAKAEQAQLFSGTDGRRQLGSAVIQLQKRIQALEQVALKSHGHEVHHDGPRPGEQPRASGSGG